MRSSRLDRRLFLASLGSAGVLAACSGRHASTLPLVGASRTLTGGATLTFDLTGTDLDPSTPVYAYIVGLVSAAHDTYYWIDSSGTARIMQAGDASQPAGDSQQPALAANYPLAWADYSIPLSVGKTTNVSLSGFNAMPELGTGTAAFSGRIFISVGTPKLPITPTGTGAVAGGGTGATGWTAPKSAIPPGYLTVYDWIEFSFDSNGNFDGNTTQVDQFGFPLGLTATPLSVGTATTLPLKASRDAIMSDIGSLPMYSGTAGAIVPVPSGAASLYPWNAGKTRQLSTIRALSPSTLVTENCYLGPMATYFFDTIVQWYSSWQSHVFQVHDVSTGWYSGFVPASGSLAGILVFYQGQLTLAQLQQNLSNAQTPDIILTGKYGSPATTNTQIVSADILACENTLNGGNTIATKAAQTAALNVSKIIAAAFNRGVMSNTLDDGNCPAPTSFYPTAAGSPPWNQWAQKMHSYNSSGLSYGFPYDDVCSQSTSIQSNPAQNITITLGTFFS